MNAKEFEAAQRERAWAARHARDQARWAVATLQVARMPEKDRMLTLIEQRYEELRHSDMTDEDLLMELYPYTPPKKETK